ncbi:hypothetical protein BB558_002164, partial [Smittium angustum]
MRLESDIDWEIQLGLDKNYKISNTLKTNGRSTLNNLKISKSSNSINNLYIDIPKSQKRYSAFCEEENKNALYIIAKFPSLATEAATWLHENKVDIDIRLNPSSHESVVDSMYSVWTEIGSCGLASNYKKKQTSVNWIDLNVSKSTNIENEKYFDSKAEREVCIASAHMCVSNLGGKFWNIEKVVDPSFKFYVNPQSGSLSKSSVSPPEFSTYYLTPKDSPSRIDDDTKNRINPPKPIMKQFIQEITKLLVHWIFLLGKPVESTLLVPDYSKAKFNNTKPQIICEQNTLELKACFFRPNHKNTSIDELHYNKNEVLSLARQYAKSKYWKFSAGSSKDQTNSLINVISILDYYPFNSDIELVQPVLTSWILELDTFVSKIDYSFGHHKVILAFMTNCDFIFESKNASEGFYSLFVPFGLNQYKIYAVQNEENIKHLNKSPYQDPIIEYNGKHAFSSPVNNLEQVKDKKTVCSSKNTSILSSFITYCGNQNYFPREIDLEINPSIIKEKQKTSSDDDETDLLNINGLAAKINEIFNIKKPQFVEELENPFGNSNIKTAELNTMKDKFYDNPFTFEGYKDELSACTLNTGETLFENKRKGSNSSLDEIYENDLNDEQVQISEKSILAFARNEHSTKLISNHVKNLDDWFDVYYINFLGNLGNFDHWYIALNTLDIIITNETKEMETVDKVLEELLLSSNEFEDVYLSKDENNNSDNCLIQEKGDMRMSFKNKRTERVHQLLNASDSKENNLATENLIMMQECRMQILLHFWCISNSNNPNVDGNKLEFDLDSEENLLFTSVNFYFDQLCIYSSLHQTDFLSNALKNKFADPAEAFLQSSLVSRFRPYLGEFIDLLFERNGYIVPKIDSQDHNDILYTKNGTIQSKREKSLRRSGSNSINNTKIPSTSSLTPNKHTPSSTRRKGNPRRIESSKEEMKTQILVSPSRGVRKAYRVNSMVNMKNDKNELSNLKNFDQNISVSSRKLARYSSMTVLKAGFENTQANRNMRTISETGRNKEFNSNNTGSRAFSRPIKRSVGSELGGFLSELGRNSSQRLSSASSATRRSSGRITMNLKQKIRSEVLLPTSINQNLTNKRGAQLSRKVSSNSGFSAGNGILSEKLNRVSVFGIEIDEKMGIGSITGVPSVLGTRTPSAQSFGSKPPKVKSPVFHRRLKRKDRSFSSQWIPKLQNINNNDLGNDKSNILDKPTSIEINDVCLKPSSNMKNGAKRSKLYIPDSPKMYQDDHIF